MSKPPKPKPPPPPPNTPSNADSSVFEAGQAADDGYTSLIATTPTGLTRKAGTAKRSLIGGG